MLLSEDLLTHLGPAHHAALQWFAEREGQEITWPDPLGEVFLLNKAKGIHKPAGWKYALSVRQSLGGPYSDKEVISEPGGSWTYDYFQEGGDPEKRDNDFTNVALMHNLADGVPVAVVHQIKSKPQPRYKVIGIARVADWKDGYFKLVGGQSTSGATASQSDHSQPAPISMEDARLRIERSIIMRQGAPAFRAAALNAFNSRCAITGCDVEAVLEAAHIVPYLGPHTNLLSNCLLLRADIHTMFDRGLLAVDPDTLKVRLVTALATGGYSDLNGVSVMLPGTDHEAWRLTFQQREDLARLSAPDGPSADHGP